MNNQALVDALIKFQAWCDEWPKIKDHIDALAAENAKLRELIARGMKFIDRQQPDRYSRNEAERHRYYDERDSLYKAFETALADKEPA